jgi:hypothetical protein
VHVTDSPDGGPEGDELAIVLPEVVDRQSHPHDAVGTHGLRLGEHPREGRVVPAVERVDVRLVAGKAGTLTAGDGGPPGRRPAGARAVETATAESLPADVLDHAAHDLADRRQADAGHRRHVGDVEK